MISSDLCRLVAPPATGSVLRLLESCALGGGVLYNGQGATAATARAAGRAGLVRYVTAREAGWSGGQWATYLTAVGWNALYGAHDGRHFPCGGTFTYDGTCDRCRSLRQLDLVAAADRLEHLHGQLLVGAVTQAQWTAEMHASRLWCDEHGFARAATMTTAKVCRQPGTSEHANPGFVRVLASALDLAGRSV